MASQPPGHSQSAAKAMVYMVMEEGLVYTSNDAAMITT